MKASKHNIKFYIIKSGREKSFLSNEKQIFQFSLIRCASDAHDGSFRFFLSVFAPCSLRTQKMNCILSLTIESNKI